jgi:putative membrane protein
MRLLTWLLRAFLFFTLFAFALNNLQDVTVHWFFGHQWQSPLVIVVLAAFGLGAGFGILAMVPAWWRTRTQVKRQIAISAPTGTEEPNASAPPVIRDGL